MALEVGDVRKVDPPPPPISGDDASPEATSPYKPDPTPVPSIVAALEPDVPDIPGGTYGTQPAVPDTEPDTASPSSVVASLDKPGVFTDVFTGKTYNYSDLAKGEAGALDIKIGADKLLEQQYRDREQRYRSQQEQLTKAEAFSVNDLKPWNAQQALAATKHDLWEQFGSPGFIFSMLASSFTAYPMVSALNGGAAAMNAINQGDMDAYNTAFDAWKENTKLLLDRHKMEQDVFNDIDKLRADNFEDWKVETAVALARFNDQRKLMLLHMGMFPELDEARKGQAEAAKQIAQARDAIEENEVQRQIVMHTIQDESGKIRPEYFNHPERIAEVMGFAKRAMTAPTNAEEAAVNAVLTSPDFPLKSNEEKSKALADAVRPIYEAKAAGRAAGLSATDAANVTKRAGELMQAAAERGEPITEGQAYNLARKELEDTKTSSRGDPLKRAQTAAILERTAAIEQEAADKGEPISHPDALARAIAEQKQKSAGGLELTADGDTKPPPGTSQNSWDFDANTFRQTGVMPSLGLGGAQYKAGLRNHAAYLEQKAGGDAGTMQARWAISKGLAKALAGFEVQDAAVEAFSRNAELNSAVLLQLAGKVDKTGVPAIERWRRWLKGGKGDDDVTAFNAQVITWRNEIAKIVTSPNLNGQLTVHAMEESKTYAGSDWSVNQIEKTVNLFRGDAERRKQSITEERNKLAFQIAHLVDQMPGKEEIPAVTAPTWLPEKYQKAAIWLATHPNDPHAEEVRQEIKKALEGVQ